MLIKILVKKFLLFILFLFVFSNPSNAQEHSPSDYVSGCMPYISIKTENYQEIKDKVNYVSASFSLSLPENEIPENLGNEIIDEKIQIRGRGNWTWQNSPKRAYKIKFDKKTSLLGMPKNKHFALISYDPFYPSLWLSPLVGMQLGRLCEFGWVPKMKPVEVSLNGEYMGIYLFVETIRSDTERLDISTQEDYCEDYEKIPYGWIIELDNQKDENQIEVPSLNKYKSLKVTYKEPECLSNQQKDWLIEEIGRLTSLIETPEENPNDSWTNYFDLKSLAKYMIVREILHDVDGYSGSQYFYKDIDSEKWYAGPLWDCEIWPFEKNNWIANNGAWSILNWIPFMMKSAELRDAFVEEWDNFFNNKFPLIFDFIDSLTVYEQADISNTRRWPSEKVSLQYKINACKEFLKTSANWINENKYWEAEYNENASIKKLEHNVEIIINKEKIIVRGNDSKIERISIHDVSGLLICNQIVDNHEVNIPIVNHGLYVIIIQVEGAGRPIHKKILL